MDAGEKKTLADIEEYGCHVIHQIIYPTTDGVWPWEPTASDWFRQRQPILSEMFRSSRRP